MAHGPVFANLATPPSYDKNILAPIVRKILTARIYDAAHETPLEPMASLSQKLGHNLLLKREDLQPVFSFKLRGAYNKIRQLPQAALEKGIICASAGNHAQGVAMSAQKLNIRAVIVMPATTPEIKVASVRARGAEVVLIGDAFDQAYEHAMSLVAQDGLTFIHPFDDEEVIAGQGTIGMEILRQAPEHLNVVFVPIGGGGLAAGVSAYIKYLQPEVRVIGVESCDAASMKAALEQGELVTLDQVGIFADGVAVKRVGENNFNLCRHTLDDVITITPDEMCAAIKDIFESSRCISEPSGALAIAGMKKYLQTYEAQGFTKPLTLAAVSSGANMNFDRLRHITERTAIGEGKEAILAVSISEEIGSFRKLCGLIADKPITEFNYRYASGQDRAQIFIGLQTSSPSDLQDVMETLNEAGNDTLDLSGNEMAKVHLRHMVGGRVVDLDNEVLYRFEFPERPGALMQFLNELGQRFNISLFHYRNHGTDYGRVLAGFQVDDHQRQAFQDHLDHLGYRYFDESNNPAYDCFLK